MKKLFFIFILFVNTVYSQKLYNYITRYVNENP